MLNVRLCVYQWNLSRYIWSKRLTFIVLVVNPKATWLTTSVNFFYHKYLYIDCRLLFQDCDRLTGIILCQVQCTVAGTKSYGILETIAAPRTSGGPHMAAINDPGPFKIAINGPPGLGPMMAKADQLLQP